MRYFVALLLLAPLVYAAEAPDGAVTDTVQIKTPAVNTDGSPLTDLERITLYWGFSPGVYADNRDIPITTAGVVHVEPVSITVVGNIGDVVTVYYMSTATDADGTVSGDSNVITRSYTIVDGTVPSPPTISFGVPIALNAVTPDGKPAGLLPVGG